MHIRRFATRLATTALVFAVLAVLVLVVGPHTGAYRTVSILSGSMEPRFGAGDMVIVVPAPTSSIRVGDVITYEAPIAGRPVVTHRVARVVRPEGRPGRPLIVTRGDANAADDPWQAQLTDDTIWRQRAVVPYAGSAVRLLRQDWARRVTVFGLPAILALLAVLDVWRRSERRAELEVEDSEFGWEWLDELELELAALELDEGVDDLDPAGVDLAAA